jgi:hypothetical protein
MHASDVDRQGVETLETVVMVETSTVPAEELPQVAAAVAVAAAAA